MGIAKLTKILPKFTKMKELELSGFRKNKLVKVFDPEKAISKAAKSRNKPKVSVTKPLSLQEEMNMIIASQAKQTAGLFIEDFAGKNRSLLMNYRRFVIKVLLQELKRLRILSSLQKFLQNKSGCL